VLSHPLVQALAYALIALGQLFVVTSIYALGVTGTYLGDYFGILMSSRVTGFPFNVLNDPMYVGSTLAFAGGALLYRSPAGLGISALVWVVYAIALKYEG
jgi:phosphatidylethanolamine N-methyltransferase